MIGALLAGGGGKRLGNKGKASVEVAGMPLAAHALAVVSQVCDRVVVVAKASTELPALEWSDRWDEPDEPQHPLTGIVYALERAGEPVLVCAADMPYLTADACRSLLAAAGGGEDVAAAVAVGGGRLCPVLGVYAPAALDVLRAAAWDAPLTETVEALDPVRVALPPPLLRSINTPEELAEAQAVLASGR